MRRESAHCRNMEAEFWRSRWSEGQIGFHRDEVHPTLTEFAANQPYFPGAVFVPLAGKSVDLPWLARQGAKVLAVELVRDAVEALFHEHALDFERTEGGELATYRATALDLTVYQGDLFSLRAEHLADVTWTHDRASVVALPEEMRTRYGQHLSHLLPQNVTLTVTTFEYDQNEMSGPPFSVPQSEVERVFPEFRFERARSRSLIEGAHHLRERGLSRLEETVLIGRRA
ncbi:MAG: thiopurine S-methyltransferase [Myxococcota bacterium]